MESSFERRGPEPEKKEAAGVSQERVDQAFAILMRGGHLFEQSPSIVREALAGDGVQATDEELMKGEIAKNAEHEGRYVDIDAMENQHSGEFSVSVNVDDKFHPVEGTPLRFRKTYRFQASPEALQAHRDAQEKERQEWAAQKAESGRQTRDMLVKLRAFVGDRLGERLTADEWKTGAHGVTEVFGSPESVPDGGSWTVEDTPDHATRLTFYGADGMVLDIAEFAAD